MVLEPRDRPADAPDTSDHAGLAEELEVGGWPGFEVREDDRGDFCVLDGDGLPGDGVDVVDVDGFYAYGEDVLADESCGAGEDYLWHIVDVVC